MAETHAGLKPAATVAPPFMEAFAGHKREGTPFVRFMTPRQAAK
jgi:hypothetical protein